MFCTEKIQQNLIKENVDAWVVYDYECNNPSLISLIGKRFLTRKVFLVIPTKGKPFIIIHKIDTVQIKDLEEHLDLCVYTNWNELMNMLKIKLKNFSKILMEVSDFGLMPHSSYTDYGTVKMIKDMGIEVKSSANLAQTLVAPFKDESLDLFTQSALNCNKAKDLAFQYIGDQIAKNGKVSEYEVQQYIMKLFVSMNMITDDDPIVAIGENANNPHYAPTAEVTSYIHEGDMVLIDLWAKINNPKAVFGDITWIGYVGDDIPQKYIERFNIIKESIDKTLEFLNKELPLRSVKGFEVDDVTRSVINKYGYGEYFIHRTGHSISIFDSPHGLGVNIDNFETHDERELINNVAFSIEPGIYAPDFGMREEIDAYVTDDRQIYIPSPRQMEIIKIKIKK